MDEPSPFRARVILLGASNVTKAISTIIETAQHLLGSPLDVYCAVGHGRSYGIKSFLVVRSVLSVLEARLWEVVREQPPLPTYALIGDIGNDVMYGPAPQTIAGWIDECFNRLDALGARTICTGLPMARAERLTDAQYLIARSLLFPTNRFTFAEAIGRAREVTRLVEDLAATRNIPFIELPGEWYGIDPIHIRRTHWAEAWGTILHHWVEDRMPERERYRARGSFARWLKLRTGSPETWWLLGMKHNRKQPCATFADGTQVSMY